MADKLWIYPSSLNSSNQQNREMDNARFFNVLAMLEYLAIFENSDVLTSTNVSFEWKAAIRMKSEPSSTIGKKLLSEDSYSLSGSSLQRVGR